MDDEVDRFQSLQTEIETLYRSANDLYERLLKSGVAKECARKVLPINTPTRIYMSGSIRSWIHYVQVRSDKSTQLEHRRIALAVKDVMRDNLPVIYEELLTDL